MWKRRSGPTPLQCLERIQWRIMSIGLFLDQETSSIISSVLEGIRQGNQKMIFFGAGRMARAFIKTYCEEKGRLPLPAYICDNNQSLWGEAIAGAPIVSPKELEREPVDNVVIVMAQVLPLTMLESLQLPYESGGLQKYYHFIMPLSQIESYLFYCENHERVDHVYAALADDRSKYVYKKYFQCLMEGHLTFPTIFTANPYWENDLVGRLEDGYVVVYAGACDGAHMSLALASNPNIELHGFEPNRNYLALLDEKYSHLPNVHIHEYGLGDEAKRLCFDNTSGHSAMTVSGPAWPEREYDTISIERLDNILNGRVDLIALDIEGDEIKALHGAERIIKESKPVLAICVYHRIEHYVEVMETIEQLCPGYEFHFRQHSIVPHESVLYAIYKEERH